MNVRSEYRIGRRFCSKKGKGFGVFFLSPSKKYIGGVGERGGIDTVYIFLEKWRGYLQVRRSRGASSLRHHLLSHTIRRQLVAPPPVDGCVEYIQTDN